MIVRLLLCVLAINSCFCQETAYRAVLWERSYEVEIVRGGWTIVELYTDEQMRDWPELYELTLSVSAEHGCPCTPSDDGVEAWYFYPDAGSAAPILRYTWTVPFKQAFEQQQQQEQTEPSRRPPALLELSTTCGCPNVQTPDGPVLATVHLEVREPIRRQHYTRSQKPFLFR